MNEVVLTQTQSNALAVPEEVRNMLAQAAKEKAEAEKSTSTPYISLKNKRFTLNEAKLGNELDVVILSDVYCNTWYDRAYADDVIVAPACFSIGQDYNSLVPHETSPVKQHNECLSCKQNEFGSATQGKGKACRNGRRLLVAPYNVKTGNLNLSELAIINISPTTLAAYSKYVKALANGFGLPTFAVVTKLSFDDDKSYPLLQFTRLAIAENPEDADLGVEYLQNIANNMVNFVDTLSAPYDVSDFEPAAPVNRSKMS